MHGVDMQLGYCAQGDRTKNVGVVDAEYIIHYGRPTLGGSDENEESSSKSSGKDHRIDVRRESYNEIKVFKRKWERAVKDDNCWIDPYNTNRWPSHNLTVFITQNITINDPKYKTRDTEHSKHTLLP
ncbi:uncharacterized protein LOC110752932 isoform X2 [Prunus avium]|nr:uncharacterized protein LOC110752932 isoform X2 [Prunus avium]